MIRKEEMLIPLRVMYRVAMAQIQKKGHNEKCDDFLEGYIQALDSAMKMVEIIFNEAEEKENA